LTLTSHYRTKLREAFDVAVREFDVPRLTTSFYGQIGDHIFERGCDALEATCAAEAGTAPEMPRLHVVSAPVGSGKTSFSMAFAAALVRISEADDSAPFGCVFVVNEITKAETLYRDLSKLIPDKVAVWTSDHDAKSKQPGTKVPNPAARFYREDLERFPVAIVTHNFYSKRDSHKAKSVLRDGVARRRALTIVDERPEEVEIYETQLSAAERAREIIKEEPDNVSTVGPHMDALVRFMRDRDSATTGSLGKPSDDPTTWDSARDDLSWFASAAAQQYANGHKSEAVPPVFNFARCLALGDAFVARKPMARS
jgi:hypothetical protein